MLDEVRVAETYGNLQKKTRFDFTPDIFDAKRAQLKELLQDVFHRAHHEDFLDALLDIRIAQLGGELIWQRIKCHEPAVLIGMGLRGMPLLHAVALAADAEGHAVQVLMVREQRKNHNLKKWVEGAMPSKNAKAILISNYLADADGFSFVRTALAADDYVVDIRAISMMLDLTAYAELSSTNFDTAAIISIFSSDEFVEELQALPDGVAALTRAHQVSLPRRDPGFMAHVRRGVEDFYRGSEKILAVRNIQSLPR
jgi:orotate phosphoribosyltransferase